MDDRRRTALEHMVGIALEEDLGAGDLTTLATVAPDTQAHARILARQPLVLAGIEVAQAVFRRTAPEAELEPVAADGAQLQTGAVVLRLTGPAAGILAGERVALNLLQHLCGVATLTRQYVDAVTGTGVAILDTRKTTPGLRAWEKHAVVCGGGRNHRFGLYDAILIKDNHLAALAQALPDPVTAAVRRAREHFPGRSVEVEADTLEQVTLAVAAGADIVLLDNMSLAELRSAVALARGRARTEASGGVNLGTVRDIAETGVDFISVGALTHSAPAVDLALDLELGQPE